MTKANTIAPIMVGSMPLNPARNFSVFSLKNIMSAIIKRFRLIIKRKRGNERKLYFKALFMSKDISAKKALVRPQPGQRNPINRLKRHSKRQPKKTIPKNSNISAKKMDNFKTLFINLSKDCHSHRSKYSQLKS